MASIFNTATALRRPRPYRTLGCALVWRARRPQALCRGRIHTAGLHEVLTCWHSSSCTEGPPGASAPSVASAAGDAAALPPPCATGSAPHRPKLRRRVPAPLFGVRTPRSIERALDMAGACEYPGGATAPHGGPGCFGAVPGAQGHASA